MMLAQNTQLKINKQQQTTQSNTLNETEKRFKFEGSGNLCDILHCKMPRDIRYWLDFYNENNPMLIKGGYEESYLNFRISCSYILYTSPDRDILYKDFKRIKDLNYNVFDFLEFFNQITNDESKREFYCKRFFKQFEYESPKSMKLLVLLAKQYSLDKIIQWIDLFTLIYEESYLSSQQTPNSQTSYPQLKQKTFY